MATERQTPEYGTDPGRRREEIKGVVFEYGLAGATLVGIVALVLLGALVFDDALGLTAASPTWFLAYFLTLVIPSGGYLLYARRRTTVWNTALLLGGVLLAGATAGTVAFAVPSALEPRDVLVYYLVGGVPAAAVFAYGRVNRSVTWTGPALPVVLAASIAAAGVFFGVLRALVDPIADWVVFYLLAVVPASLVVRFVVARRFPSKFATPAAVATMLVGLAGYLVGGLLPGDPGIWITFSATLLVPVGVLVADTAVNRREGLPGLGWPAVVGGGILVGSLAVEALGVTGPDSWLTATLLTESFSTLSPESAGIYPQLVGSIIMVSLMGILVFPVGVGAAVYLEEYAPSSGLGGRFTQFLQVNISNLAGIPSVVYGLLGLGLFVNLLGQPRGLVIAGSVTLGLLILPIVIVSAQEAVRSVPDSHRQAAYGMGASRWQTVRNVVLPQAFPGILTGTILALGRAIGETAPILLIGLATSKTNPPSGLFEKGAALPLQIFASRSLPQPEYRYGVLAAAVVVLLGLMLLMNAAAIVLRNKYQRRS